MSTSKCPKCGGPMDTGRVETPLVYKSDQPGFFSSRYLVHQAQACTQCGYLEFYLNPEKLEKLNEWSTQLA